MKYPIFLVPQAPAGRDLSLTIAMRREDDTSETAKPLRTAAALLAAPVGVPVANPIFAGQSLYPQGIIPRDPALTIKMRKTGA